METNCANCTKRQVCWTNTEDSIEKLIGKFIDNNMKVSDIDEKMEFFENFNELFAKYCDFYNPET